MYGLVMLMPGGFDYCKGASDHLLLRVYRGFRNFEIWKVTNWNGVKNHLSS